MSRIPARPEPIDDAQQWPGVPARGAYAQQQAGNILALYAQRGRVLVESQSFGPARYQGAANAYEPLGDYYVQRSDENRDVVVVLTAMMPEYYSIGDVQVQITATEWAGTGGGTVTSNEIRSQGIRPSYPWEVDDTEIRLWRVRQQRNLAVFVTEPLATAASLSLEQKFQVFVRAENIAAILGLLIYEQAYVDTADFP